MEGFTNNPIDTNALPRFESVPLEPIQASYWKIVRLNLIIVAVLVSAIVISIFTLSEVAPIAWAIPPIAAVFIVTLFVLYRKALRNMGFAFRDHDVIFRHGVITHTTTVIPYNRIQHVALHEGWYSRLLGLAKIQVYTAGSGAGDISIPGLEAAHAADIKQLLMGKIQMEL